MRLHWTSEKFQLLLLLVLDLGGTAGDPAGLRSVVVYVQTIKSWDVILACRMDNQMWSQEINSAAALKGGVKHHLSERFIAAAFCKNGWRILNNWHPEGLHQGQRRKWLLSQSQLHLHMDSRCSSLMGFAFFKRFSIRRLLNSSQGFSLLLYKILASEESAEQDSQEMFI